jgi:hypothetical protein
MSTGREIQDKPPILVPQNLASLPFTFDMKNELEGLFLLKKKKKKKKKKS